MSLLTLWTEAEIFNYYIEINEKVKEKYTLIFPVENPICFLRINEAKQAANKHYKEKLKKKHQYYDKRRNYKTRQTNRTSLL